MTVQHPISLMLIKFGALFFHHSKEDLMKKLLLVLSVFLLLAIAGTAAAAPGNSRNFVAHLQGSNEALTAS